MSRLIKRKMFHISSCHVGFKILCDFIVSDEESYSSWRIIFNRVEDDRRVLDDGETIKSVEQLQAPSNLKILNVDGYRGTRMPKWIFLLPCLVTLQLKKCKQLEYLKTFENAEGPFLPYLRTLELFDMSNLKGWRRGGVGVGVEESSNSQLHLLSSLPRLENLVIQNCPELMCIPLCNEVEIVFESPKLRYVQIDDVAWLNSLPTEAFQCLETLEIFNDQEVQNLGEVEKVFRGCSSLRFLKIFNCSELRSVFVGGLEHLSSLETLEITDCEKLDEKEDLIKKTNETDETDSSQIDGKLLPKTAGNRWLISLVFNAILRMKFDIAYKKREELELHCSIFPSGYEFEREKLIQLWMAVGFFEIEEVGNMIFDVLVEQNCILLAGTDILTGKSKFKFDKFTSAFIDIGYYVKFANKHEVLDFIESNFWHVSVVSDYIDHTVFERLKNFSELRTLLFTRNYGSSLKQVPSDVFIALQSLQALDLSGSHLVELPSSVGNLVFLRYLDLSFTLIESLPESIDCLRELQTLKLEGCKHIYKLPKGMKELIKLRYLELDVLGQLTYMPKGIGKLIELRTLSAFIVESEEGCSIRELKNMNNLRGHFCISGLENASSEEIEQANIKDKKHITRLQLRWNDSHCVQECGDYSSIVDHLMPNYHLEELQILHYPAQKLPKWTGFSEFVKIVSIVFINCAIEELNITLGMLPNLKHVQIIQMNRLVVINQGIHNSSDGSRGIFPKLETLSIEGMSSLECWRDTKDGDFPLLSKLIIEQCPKLTELPFLPYLQSLNHLKISDCTTFQALPEGKLSSSLQTLAIDDCPLLEKRCNKECEDWHKIEHVLNILINMNDVRSEHEEEPRSDSDSDDCEDSNGQIQLDNNHH